jgi:hypothetical protein
VRVWELIALLSKFDPKARVFVARGSDDRELNPDDVVATTGVVRTDDGEEHDGPFLSILTWS